MTGLRAELAIPDLDSCPVAVASDESGERIDSISWAREQDGTVTEEFTASDDFDTEAFESDVEKIFDYHAESVYQFERSAEPCLCEYLQQESHPIRDVTAEDGGLVVTLHLDSRDGLREIISQLRDRFGPVRLRNLMQVDPDSRGGDIVPVDRDRLTDRQREVLTVAYELGYFASPREANATAVADELDIDVSTFTEHLATAQSRLMADILES